MCTEVSCIITIWPTVGLHSWMIAKLCCVVVVYFRLLKLVKVILLTLFILSHLLRLSVSPVFSCIYQLSHLFLYILCQLRCVSFVISTYLYLYMHIYICVSIWLPFIQLSIYKCLSTCLSIYLSNYLSVFQTIIHPSIHPLTHLVLKIYITKTSCIRTYITNTSCTRTYITKTSCRTCEISPLFPCHMIPFSFTILPLSLSYSLCYQFQLSLRISPIPPANLSKVPSYFLPHSPFQFCPLSPQFLPFSQSISPKLYFLPISLTSANFSHFQPIAHILLANSSRSPFHFLPSSFPIPSPPYVN